MYMKTPKKPCNLIFEPTIFFSIGGDNDYYTTPQGHRKKKKHITEKSPQNV
jgi:hypothetical protein